MHHWKTILLLAAYVAILVAIGAVGYKIGFGNVYKVVVEHANRPTEYYELPEMAINMVSGTQISRPTEIALDLEVDVKDLKLVDSYKPRIMDRIQTFMRRIPLEDMKSPSGMHWLTDDLLWEINLVSGPVRIKDITVRKLVLP